MKRNRYSVVMYLGYEERGSEDNSKSYKYIMKAVTD